MPEKTSEISYIQVQNRNEQNAGQAGAQQNYGNNLPLQPSVADLNRITGVSEGSGAAQQPQPQPLFGTHIVEAVAIVKDWAR